MAERGGEVRIFITAVTKGLKSGLSSATKFLKNTFVPSAQTAMRVFTAAVVGGFTAAIIAAAKFEKQMSKVGSLLGDQEKSILPKFAKGVRELAIATGQATSELSEGLFDIVSAGIPAAESLDILTAAAKLAVAGFTTTTAATQALITVMQTFKGEITDAADATDFLFAVQKGGRLTVEQVATQLGKFAATGKAAGISARDLGVAFATISLGGERADISATQLRAILLKLSKDQERMAKSAREVGIEIDFQKLKTEGLLPFLEQFKDLSGENRAKIFQESEAINGLNKILGNLGRAHEISALITNRAGVAQAAFARRAEEVSFMFDRLIEVGKAFAVIFGEQITPLVKELLQFVLDNKDDILAFATDLGKNLAKITKELKEWGVLLTDIVTKATSFADKMQDAARSRLELLGRTVGKVIGGGIAGGLGAVLGGLFGAGTVGLVTGAGGGLRSAVGIGGGRRGGRAPGGRGAPAGQAGEDFKTDKELFDFFEEFDRKAADPKTPSKFAKAWEKAFNKTFKAGDDLAQTLQSAMQGLIGVLSESFQALFIGLADGTANFGEVMNNMVLGLRNLVFKIIGEMLAKMIAAFVLAKIKAIAHTILELGLAAAVAKAWATASQAKFGWFGLITAVALAAAFGALVASAGKFAEGGIVPGFGGGDTVPAMLTPGEIVLNKRQQMALLKGGAGGGGSVVVNISGTFLEGNMAKWQKLVRRAIIPELDRHGFKTRRTGETIL